MKNQKRISQEIHTQLQSILDPITLKIDSFEIHDYISFSNLKDREQSIDFFPKKPALFER